MHASLHLLDEAMLIIRQEAAAIEAEDDELLESLCERRAVLLHEAWAKRDGCDPVRMTDALTALQDIQKTLRVRTRSLADELSDELKASRKEGSRIRGYQKTVSGNTRALYIRRTG